MKLSVSKKRDCGALQMTHRLTNDLNTFKLLWSLHPWSEKDYLDNFFHRSGISVQCLPFWNSLYLQVALSLRGLLPWIFCFLFSQRKDWPYFALPILVYFGPPLGQIGLKKIGITVRPPLVDYPTQLICTWIFICWIGGGDSIQGVVKCSSSYFRQEWTF